MKALLMLSVVCLSSCAAHNAHLVPLDFEGAVHHLVSESLDDLEVRHGQELPGALLLVVDVDRLDVCFEMEPEASFSSADSISPVQLQRALEVHMQQRLGAALVLAPAEGDYWEAADCMLQIRLLLDLHAPDQLKIQAQTLLIRSQQPDEIWAVGWSSVLALERAYCHGCRDRIFRNKGRNLSFAKGTGEGFLNSGLLSVSHSHNRWGHHHAAHPQAIYRTQR